MSKPISVILVDDHPVVRAGCRLLLESCEGVRVVMEAESGTGALKQIAAHAPDVVVLDIAMPDMNGLEVLLKLAQRGERSRVLMLSAYDTPFMAQRVLEAGAHGYLSKSALAGELCEAVRNISLGKRHVDGATAQKMVAARLLDNPHPLTALTEREFIVFLKLAGGASSRQVAKELNISINTVQTHYTNLKQKLHLRNGTDLTRLAIRHHLLEP